MLQYYIEVLFHVKYGDACVLESLHTYGNAHVLESLHTYGYACVLKILHTSQTDIPFGNVNT